MIRRPPTSTRTATLSPYTTLFRSTVIVADVYAAGEQPIEGVDRDHLVEALRPRGHRHVLALPGPEQLPGMVMELAQPGDLVVCLGAGNITAWANALPGELQALLAAGGGQDRKRTRLNSSTNAQ